jgi:hypothetical protein
MRFRFPAAALAVAVLCTTALSAQKTTQLKVGGGGSPHVRSEFVVDGANISIEYGRPSLKGRAEAELMPAGTEWRTGADEATTITLDTGIMFSTLHVNPGTYTLYTVPGPRNWQLIISKKTGQWGIPYPKGEDLGRTLMTVSKNATPVEQLTITVEDTKAGGQLNIEWGTTKASVPFTIMPKM